MRGIAQGITKMAGAARNKKLGMSDMQGSTFTITNPGRSRVGVGADHQQPNTGILCTDGVKRRPRWPSGHDRDPPTGIIGLVYDHRASTAPRPRCSDAHRDSLDQPRLGGGGRVTWVRRRTGDGDGRPARRTGAGVGLRGLGDAVTAGASTFPGTSVLA